ncbi:SOS response-associated peptidase family protein [Novosphingobium sp.]|uniref:SOS response-associated peptidase family protein n=1 Tax=Novosphingobium sp. TaxID=1874826 RepID=UPI0025DCEB29|nr:SOS response-associated peptidase family protein [Novosphingobium sp.]
MTILYRLDASAAQLGARFDADPGQDPWAGGMLAPGQFAPVITQGREAIAGPRAAHQPRRLIPRLWGVPPPPAAGWNGRPVLSVRNLESPFWIGNLRNSEFRCLVPAGAFMIWGKGVDRDGKRVRHWLGCTDQPCFAFAGVWKDSEIPSFALLSCEPNALLRDLGAERMPVILPDDPAAWRLWLNGGWDRAGALVQPYSSSAMTEFVN